MTEINPSKAPGSAYMPQSVDPLKGEVPAVTYARAREDAISVADKKEEEYQAPSSDAPGITPPADKNQDAVDGAIKANPWLNNPNVTALLFLVLLDYQKGMSIQRVTEADMKIVLSEATFKVGMENADLVKKLKDLEADKQFLEAMGNFANAAVAVGSIGMVAAQRSQAQAQTDSSPAGVTRNQEKANMEKLDAKYAPPPENLSPKTPTQTASEISAEAAHASTEASANTKPPEKQSAEAYLNTHGTPEEKAEYRAQKEKLATAQKSYDIEYQTNLTTNQAIERHASDALKSVVNGTIQMISAGITKEQGAVDKLKASNETMQQFWSRIIDSSSKSKEDLQAEISRVLQLLTSWSSETRNRIQRG